MLLNLRAHRRRLKFFLFPIVVWLAAATNGAADVTLASLFTHGVVLQRDQPIPIWGSASSGERIEVEFGGVKLSTATREDGTWRVDLPAQPASSELRELIVRGRDTVRVRDVLIGDVWLCSGQSNMAFVVSRGLTAEAEIGVANFPLIRHYLVPRRVAEKPQHMTGGSWESCHPDSVANFSAVAYFFARELHLRTGVPIGLINATWGGTQIESWMSESAVRANAAADAIYNRWQKRLADHPRKVAEYERALAAWKAHADAARQKGVEFAEPAPRAPEGPGSRWMPSGLYNAMIAPLQPMALRGVLWYQGEANASRASEYTSLFPEMIQQWRADFGQELPFYFVQLANHDRESDKTQLTWAFLREAQQAALALPHTGMAVAIDIGEVKDVHPKNKQEVGRRLALIARAKLEQEKIEDSGPIFSKVVAEPGGHLRVIFEHANGLNSRGREIVAVEVAGEDRQFVRAEARIEGDSLVVRSPQVSAPVAVRYAWHNFPEATLCNGAGLPAAPFRSHPW